MKQHIYILWLLTMGLGETLGAQTLIHVDTLPSRVPQTHQYLHLKVPTGELYMRSSETCGMSMARLQTDHAAVRHHISEELDAHGYHHRKVELVNRNAPSSTNLPAGSQSNLRIAAEAPSIPLMDEPTAYRSEFTLDPNLPTDLVLDMGMGATRLDLSGLSLSNLTINAAFSDVMLAYRTANKVNMEKLNLHVTKGDVMLKHPELAKARLISVQNDMGDTKILLGETPTEHTSLVVQNGVGTCTLIIDADHPVQLVVKGGLFSRKSIPDTFTQVGDAMYVNQAYTSHCTQKATNCKHATRIVCTLDLGNLSVIEKP